MQDPFPEEGELAILGLEWLAAYYPNSLRRFKKRIRNLRAKFLFHPYYGFQYWYRLVYVDCILYLLEKISGFLNVVIANINHHKSSLRLSVFNALYYVAPFLNFYEETEFKERTASNLIHGHIYNELNLYLIHLMKGDRKDKVSLYKQWLEDPQIVKYCDNIKILNDYIKYENRINPFIELEYKLWNYLFKKYLKLKTTPPKRLTLFDDE
ncbi:MAG: hypothetical protein N2748_04130 [candidate division WOR-3 bacterium]|nr:hypothetical protein [candidate division WOR-3 bacterium]